MPKKFLSNVLLLLAANLLIKPFWILGIDRTVQNGIGNEAYGAYINLFSISLMFSMLLDFGINNYTSTFIARHKQLLDKKFAALLPLKLLFSTVYIITTALFAIIYGIKGYQLLLLIWLSANQALAFFILFFRANISGLQLFKTDSLLSVSDRGMMIIFAIALYFMLNGNFTIEHFIMVQSAGYLTSLGISFFTLKPHLQRISLTFNKLMMFSIIRQSWPYALLALLMTIYTRTDYLLIKKLLADGDIQNGIYAVANRLFEAANMLAVLVAGMLLSLFANMIKKQEDVTQLVKICMVMLIVPSTMVASISWFYSYDIISLLSDHNPAASGEVFKYVMISFVAMCVMYIFGTLLTAGTHLKTLNILAAIAIVISISLNLFMIPRYGAKGAAVTAVITHGFIAVSNAFFAWRLNKLHISLWFIFSLFIVIVFTIASNAYFKLMGVDIILASFYSGVLILVLLFFTRIISISQIKQLVERRYSFNKS